MFGQDDKYVTLTSQMQTETFTLCLNISLLSDR